MIDQRWARRIEELLARNPNLLATSVYRLLVAEGLEASYPTLVRHLRAVGDPPPPCTADLELGPGDYQAATPDLAARYDLDGGEGA